MVTDTIGFRTSNVSPDVLRVAAGLMEHGADLSAVYYSALVQHSYPAVCYWGAGLSRLQSESGLVWTSLSLADRRAVGYKGRDDADLINVLSTIEEAEIAIVFIEQSAGRVKISWRVCGQASTGLDVSVVAQIFGGGGHRAASGAEVDGSLEDVQANVLEETRLYMSRLHGERVSPEN